MQYMSTRFSYLTVDGSKSLYIISIVLSLYVLSNSGFHTQWEVSSGNNHVKWHSLVVNGCCTASATSNTGTHTHTLHHSAVYVYHCLLSKHPSVVILAQITNTSAIVCLNIIWSVCVCVCVCVCVGHSGEPAKLAKPNQLTLGGRRQSRGTTEPCISLSTYGCNLANTVKWSKLVSDAGCCYPYWSN